MRRGRPSNHINKQETHTDILKFWQVKDQYLFDTPHPACDHGTWLEKTMGNFCNDMHQKLELSYQCYKKLVHLESSVNITMFITGCNEITTQCLQEQLVQRITGTISKNRLELTLLASPLFSFDNNHKVWKRKGISHCKGKNVIYFFHKKLWFLIVLLL